MIQSKAELNDYLYTDKVALGRVKMNHPSAGDLIWKYEISLRYCEYFNNVGGGYFSRIFHNLRYKLLGIICGFEIPLNCIGKGLSIAHKGTIIINKAARIGENCRIHVGVNIGTVPGCESIAPKVGNNVYIAPGVKMYGKIEVASGIIVGANSVVTKVF